MAVTTAPKIITTRFDQPDGHTLAGYQRTGGYEALRTALVGSPEDVLGAVKAANIQGRGGAGFPAGIKWGFLPPDVHPRYVVVNGDESEPGTYKDRLLMERDPHQLIEGVLLTSYAVGAKQAFIYVRGEMALAQERIATALNEAYAAGLVGRDIDGSGWSLDVLLHWGAGAYIVGEETALIESLEGRRGMPRLKPPFFPAAKGLYLQPTIVNNVETLCNIPWIVRNGGEAFAAIGNEESAGMRLFALSGHVRRPGVYEVEMGKTTFRDLIEAPVYGGGMRDGNALKAFIPGGASAPWFYEEHLDLPLSKPAIDKAGSMLGSGAIVVMDETTDAVKACARVVRFFAHESCGKCTPCREGTTWLQQILNRILAGDGRPSDLELLLDVCDNISPGIAWPPRQTTICPLGPSAVSPIASALERFRPEFEAYIAGGRHAGAVRIPSRQERRPVAEGSEAATAVTITVDGRPVTAKPGEMLIAAAERAGTYIPRFCYHPRMQPVGMCRMCLVEVDTGRGPALQPSCMIPVADGMVVETESPVTKKAQDGVLEFLLINHPLDCPVCDKGGECPLQDQTLAFGPGESRFVEEKRHYEKPIPLSDLVYMDRERCILCDRCTRFSKEVAGDPLITFIDRGNATQVNTFPDDPFASYFSGNTVQICPVGALLAKPYRFKARPWDLDQVESTCTACSVGCRMAVQSSSNRLVRHLGIDVDPVNWGWLCDKGRFDFEAVNAEDRLRTPLVRKGDELVEASWSEALVKAAEGLAGAIDRHGPASVAVLGGARLTNEDAYAWSKLARTVFGTDNVDAQLGDGLPAEAVLGLPRASIDAACAAGTVVLLAPDLKEELPVLYLRLRDAVVQRGLRLIELSPHQTGLTTLSAASLRYRPGEAAQLLRSLVAGGGDDAALRAAAELLGDGPVVCVLGRPSLAESGASVVAAAAALLEARPGTTFLSALRRGNVHGALDMGLAPGVLPGRVSLDTGRDWYAEAWGSLPEARGLDATGTLDAAASGRIQGLVLLGADPLADFPDRDLARRGVAGAGFVVAVDTFLTESSRQADVVLPVATFGERSGTTTNLEGRISRLAQKVTSPGTSRVDWMIAVELADRMGADLGFESFADIWDEVERLAPSHAGITRARLSSPEGLDGILAGAVDDVAAEGAPPSMSQADAPGINAAAAQSQAHLPGSSQTGEMAEGEGTAGQGAEGAKGSEALAESFGAASDTADYADGTSEEAAGDEAAAIEAATEAAGEGDDGGEPSGGGTQGAAAADRPDPLRYVAAEAPGGPPPIDSYSLRLVAGRKLYDAGTFVTHSPSLAPLAATAPLRVHPSDLERLGLTSGARVRVTSSRTSLVLVAEADAGVPVRTAVLTFNQPGPGAADLIDATGLVTDVRIETLAQAGTGSVPGTRAGEGAS